MYMAHVNFRPVDDGRLVQTALRTPEHVRVRTSIPSHVKPGPGFLRFIDELAENPGQHHVLKPGLAFDPEIVFFIDYHADPEGWAHACRSPRWQRRLHSPQARATRPGSALD